MNPMPIGTPVGGVMSHRNVVVRHLGVLGSAAALVSTRLAKETMSNNQEIIVKRDRK
tara:strand:- start:845 stop:1015 length:171 start_codon:yes stop_codon:yes gene_type:complete